MKFGVICCGSIGQRHIKTALELGHEVIAYNRGKKRRDLVAQSFGIKVFKNCHSLFQEGVDAAIICSPNNLHVEHSLQAAKAGCHLFIEKPLSHSMEGIKALSHEIKNRSLITHVASNMRFHFGPSLIKKMFDKGVIGNPLWAYFWGGMYLPDWHPNEDYRIMYSALKSLGGGVVLDFIHEQDLILWFFGKPATVSAMINKSGCLEIETEDIADAILSYSKNFQVNLHMDYLQKPFQRGIRLFGCKGWMEWSLDNDYVKVFDSKTNQLDLKHFPKKFSKQDMYESQMIYFIDCIRHQKPSMSNIESGIDALKLALTIKESSEKKKFIAF